MLYLKKINNMIVKNEKMLFFKRALKNPKALGALFPSSKSLGHFIARHIQKSPDMGYIIEVGAGTGGITRSLLNTGIQPDRLIIIEMDLELCQYLREHFKDMTIIQGNAIHLETLLPPQVLGKVDMVISGIPLINLSRHDQNILYHALKQVLKPGGAILQFTYGPVSPFVEFKKCGFKAKRIGFIMRNLPPASVWSYTHKDIIQIQNYKKTGDL